MAATSCLLQANLGIGQISLANSNLDGTGDVTSCFTAANAFGGSIAGGGSIVTRVLIKSTDSITSQGMVRLFIYNGMSYFLFLEVPVPPTTQSGVLETFSCEVVMQQNLEAGFQIFASTETADPFNVFVYGYNYGYIAPSGTINVESIMNSSNTGVTSIKFANAEIDGSGPVGILLTAKNAPPNANNGTTVKRISIKAQQSTTQGMVRFFVHNTASSKTFLWRECSIPAQTQSSVNPTFSTFMPVALVLNPGYQLWVSTENGETFDVTADANDFVSIIPS